MDAERSHLQNGSNCGRFLPMGPVEDRIRNVGRSHTSNGGYRCRSVISPSRPSRRRRDLMGLVLGLGIGLLLDVWLSGETFFELATRIFHGLQ